MVTDIENAKNVLQTIGNKVIEYINGGIQMNFDLHKMPTTMSDLLQTNKKLENSIEKQNDMIDELKEMIQELKTNMDEFREEHNM